MKLSKVRFYSISLAIIAEIFILYLVYFNQTQLAPIINPQKQMWISATMNFCSALFLLIAFVFIKMKQQKLHIIFIHFALLASAFFLINYIIYHMSIGHTIFQDNQYRTAYLLILVTHLTSSIISLPLIFLTYGYAVTNHLKEHKKIALKTFVLWELVSVTGVIIVLMLKFLNT